RCRGLVPEGVCLSSATFYRARRALCAQFGLERRSVTPSSSLEELIPAQGRRDHWQRFCAALGPFDLPGLQRPRWLRIALASGYLGLFLTGLLCGLVAFFRGQSTTVGS